jgi:hypothetical protein
VAIFNGNNINNKLLAEKYQGQYLLYQKYCNVKQKHYNIINLIVKSSYMKWVLIIFGVLCACCLCVIAFFGITLGLGYKSLTDQLKDMSGNLEQACSLNNNNLANFYDKYTTDNFKTKTTLEQFQQFFTNNADIFQNCKNTISNIDIVKMYNNSIAADYSSDNNGTFLNLKFNQGSKKVTFQLQKVNGSWLFNAMKVEAL